MNNPRVTPKDRNGIKGAIRRVFSRSELHKAVINASVVPHSDPSRPRVKTWARCAVCLKLDAKSYMAVDHISPVIETNTTLEAITWDTLVDRIWCEQNNLQVICPTCHDQKSAIERQERKEHKKRNKK